MSRPDLPRTLLLLLLFDLLLQGFGLWRSLDVHPGILAPTGDAAEYWEMSGQIAEGNLVGETPFLSAPLYPYFVGGLRALGGGMVTVFVVQLLLRALTAWLLARSATRLFGHLGYGLATAALFLWLEEPAFYAVRLLNSSLQLAVLAGLIHACIAWREDWNPKRRVGFGALLGLSILSNPALLITLPFFAWWLGVRPPQQKGTAIALGTTFACILPATWHNYLATVDTPHGAEFILLSAQAGVTFSHGNAAGAVGTYRPLEGVSLDRQKQNADAFRIAAEATGEPGWANTSSYFLDRGLDYLKSDPAAALRLEFAKLRWFFCGRNYGDLFNIKLENADDGWPRQVPLPGGLLNLGWLLPSAFFGLILLIRRDRRQAIPIATLLGATLFVVLVFWYSPRYRLPAAPLAVLLAPWAVMRAAAMLGRGRQIGVIAALAIAPALILEGWTQLSGFDPKEDVRAQYEMHVGLQYLDREEYHLALPRLRRSLEEGHENAEVHHGIAECLVKMGTAEDQQGRRAEADALYLEAIGHYRKGVALNPTRLDTAFSLGSVLAYVGQVEEARTVLQAALSEAETQAEVAMIDRLRRTLASLPN
ncbi:MAG: ArnT family glycosyltransferase [Planctomycetota bacterium]